MQHATPLLGERCVAPENHFRHVTLKKVRALTARDASRHKRLNPAKTDSFQPPEMPIWHVTWEQ